MQPNKEWRRMYVCGSEKESLKEMKVEKEGQLERLEICPITLRPNNIFV